MSKESKKIQKLCRIIQTRRYGYWILIEALEKTSQSGPLSILTSVDVYEDALKEFMARKVRWKNQTVDIKFITKGMPREIIIEILRAAMGSSFWTTEIPQSRYDILYSEPQKLPGYKERRILQNCTLKPEVFTTDSTDIFVFTKGMTRADLTHFLRSAFPTETSREFLTEKQVSSRHIILLCDKHIPQISQYAFEHSVNIHIIEYVSENFFWKYTFGSALLLRTYFFETIPNELSEYELISNFKIDKYVKNLVVSDIPGVGKSVMLRHLAKHLFEDNELVLELSMSQILSEFSILHFVDEIKVLEFIRKQLKRLASTDDKCQCAVRDKILFELLDNSSDTIFVVIDGLDEIPNQFLDKSIQILKTLTKIDQIKLIVAMRPDISNIPYLLGTVPYYFKPFDKGDQVNFLVDYWREVESSDIGKKYPVLVNNFAEFCVEQFHRIISYESIKIAGIAILCKFLAEITRKHYLELSHEEDNSGNSTNLYEQRFLGTTVADIYDRFMNHKIELLEKTTCFENITDFRLKIERYLMFLAWRELFPDINISNTLSKEASDSFVNVGFCVLIEEKISFAHRSYAEYWLARLITKILRPRVEPMLSNAYTSEIIHCIFKNSFAVYEQEESALKFPHENEVLKTCRFQNTLVTYFVNAHLTDESKDFHYPLLEEKGGREVMWNILTACVVDKREKLFESIGLLNAALQRKEEWSHTDLDSTLNLVMITAKYATCKFFRKHWRVVLNEFNSTKNYFTFPFQRYKVLVRMKMMALKIAAENGKYGILEELIDIEKISMLRTLNLLHICVRDTVQCASDDVLSKQEIVSRLCTILDSATESRLEFDDSTPILQPRINLRLLSLLIENTNDINHRTFTYDSILHTPLLRSSLSPTMSLTDYTNLVAMLKERNNNISQESTPESFKIFQHFCSPNSDGKVPLHLAVESMEIDKKLLQTFQGIGDISVKDNTGENILFAAVRNGRTLKCIKAIINYGGLVLVEAKNTKNENLLHLAVQYGSTEVFDYILQRFPFMINETTESGDNALHILFKRNSEDSLHLLTRLIVNNINLEHTNGAGHTPIAESLRIGSSLKLTLEMLHILAQKGKIVSPEIASQCIQALFLNLSIVASLNYEDFKQILRLLLECGGDFCFDGAVSPWQQPAIRECLQEICRKHPGSVAALNNVLQPSQRNMAESINEASEASMNFLRHAEYSHVKLAQACFALLLEKELSAFCLIRQRLRENSDSDLIFRTPPEHILKYLQNIESTSNQRVTVQTIDVLCYAEKILQTIGENIKVITGYNMTNACQKADVALVLTGDSVDLLNPSLNFNMYGKLVIQVSSLSEDFFEDHIRKTFHKDELTWNTLTKSCKRKLLIKLDDYIYGRAKKIITSMSDYTLEALAQEAKGHILHKILSRRLSSGGRSSCISLLKSVYCHFFRRRYEKSLQNLQPSTVLLMLESTKFTNVVIRSIIEAKLSKDFRLEDCSERAYLDIAFGNPNSRMYNIERIITESIDFETSTFVSKDELIYAFGMKYSQNNKNDKLAKAILENVFKIHERELEVYEQGFQQLLNRSRKVTYFKLHYPILLYAISKHMQKPPFPSEGEGFKLLLACITDDLVEYVEKMDEKALFGLSKDDFTRSMEVLMMLGSIEMIRIVFAKAKGFFRGNFKDAPPASLFNLIMHRGNYRIFDYVLNHPDSLLKPYIETVTVDRTQQWIQHCVCNTSNCNTLQLKARIYMINVLWEKFGQNQTDILDRLLVLSNATHISLIQHLVQIGGSPFETDENNNNIAHLAASYLSKKDYLELARFLIQYNHGTVFKNRNKDHKSPIRCALENLPSHEVESEDYICKLLVLLRDKVHIDYKKPNNHHLTIIQCAEQQVNIGRRHKCVLDEIRTQAGRKMSSQVCNADQTQD